MIASKVAKHPPQDDFRQVLCPESAEIPAEQEPTSLVVTKLTKSTAARAADDELAHVRDVEQPAALAHRLVFGGDALRVLDRHLVAGERDDLGAERDVLFVEGRALERGRSGAVVMGRICRKAARVVARA